MYLIYFHAIGRLCQIKVRFNLYETEKEACAKIQKWNIASIIMSDEVGQMGLQNIQVYQLNVKWISSHFAINLFIAAGRYEDELNVVHCYFQL